MCSGDSQTVPSQQGHVVATNPRRGPWPMHHKQKKKTKQEIIEIIQAGETRKTVKLCSVCCLLGVGTQAPVSGRAPRRQGGGTVEAPTPASSMRHPASGCWGQARRGGGHRVTNSSHVALCHPAGRMKARVITPPCTCRDQGRRTPPRRAS